MRSKRTRDQPRKFILTDLLGSGTYNCAYYLTEDNNVLRIGFLPYSNPAASTIVKRGLEMVHVFQSFQNALGPSLLQEMTQYQIIDEKDLDKHVEGELCSTIEDTRNLPENVITEDDLEIDDKAKNEFALQHIEFLSGGDFTYTSLKKLRAKSNVNMGSDDICFATFSLLWFFSMSQQLFGFRHHDLKGANMMIRYTTELKEYTFEIEAVLYRFRSFFVPVVIDYDFGSVYSTTTPEDRDQKGTPYTRSPDHLLWSMYEREGYKYDFKYNPHVYDYWSLGICFFELLCDIPKGIWTLFEQECLYFTRTIKEANTFLNVDRESMDYFFYGLCFLAVVHNTSSLQPPRKYYGFIANVPSAAQWNDISDYVFKQPDYKLLKSKWNDNSIFPPGLKSIIRKLLSLNPGERNASNQPMKLILEETYFEKNTFTKKRGEKLSPYKGTNKPILSDEELVQVDSAKLKGIAFLEGKVCFTCSEKYDSSKTFYLCECCAKPFCGEGCQREKH